MKRIRLHINLTKKKYVPRRLKYVFLILTLHVSGVFSGQETIELDVTPYLLRIERLVDEKLANNKDKSTENTLRLKYANTTGIERVNTCLELYTLFIFRSVEIAENYNDEAFLLSTELGYESGLLQSVYNKAYFLFISGDFDASLEHIAKIETAKSISEYPEIHADCQTLRSYIHTERGEYDVALETSLNLLEKGEQSDNQYILMRAYSGISHFYLRLGEIEKAMMNCLRGLDIILTLKKTQYIFPKIDELARMTHELEGSKKALEIYDFYLQTEQKVSKQGHYIQSVVYMNIADIHIQEKNFDEAENYLFKALNLIHMNKFKFRKPRAYVLIAELYMARGDSLRAIDNYEKAYVAAQEINAFDVIKNTCGSLATLYRSRGDQDKADTYNTRHRVVSDSLFSIESSQKIKILEARRDILEVSRQKELLEVQNNAQRERFRLTILILVITAIAGGIATFSYLKVRRKNRLLFDRTKELALANLHIEGEQGRRTENAAPPESQADDPGLEQSAINEDVKDIILAKLKNQEGQRFYLDPNCTLHRLSDKLQTNQKYLSQVINQEKKTNFNNYLNELRINYLLKRLVDDRDLRNSKLSYIAVQSGYNNLNTFNTAFKKRLGILPSYFIRELNEDEK